MSHHPRPTGIFPPSGTTSSFRQPSIHSNPSQQQSSALAMRVESKRAELENLKRLRDLSGTLASQMQALEEKLGTLRDGTEAVAHVLANWENVLRAISMASAKVPLPTDSMQDKTETPDVPLPATLVRIPAEETSNSRGNKAGEGHED
ncbi:hypothetical protein FQN54_007302 [Arachnomyces sp. PD_36]|nr:hypothetical protein FQN54_007302 [Arachnomyces sp. PD_36]